MFFIHKRKLRITTFKLLIYLTLVTLTSNIQFIREINYPGVILTVFKTLIFLFRTYMYFSLFISSDIVLIYYSYLKKSTLLICKLKMISSSDSI